MVTVARCSSVPLLIARPKRTRSDGVDRNALARIGWRERKMVSILPGGSPKVIAARGQEWLDANPDEAEDAVVAVDGFVTMAAGRKDAIILDMRSYRGPTPRLRVAVPYRQHHDPAGFAIHRPKFIVAKLEEHDSAAMMEAFFNGVFSHEYGRRIWLECADGSG
jgi:hypothetical protein